MSTAHNLIDYVPMVQYKEIPDDGTARSTLINLQISLHNLRESSDDLSFCPGCDYLVDECECRWWTRLFRWLTKG